MQAGDGWERWFVENMIVLQTCRPELETRNPIQDMGILACAYNLSSGKADRNGLLGLIDSSVYLLGDFQASRKPLSPKRWAVLEKYLLRSYFWPPNT